MRDRIIYVCKDLSPDNKEEKHEKETFCNRTGGYDGHRDRLRFQQHDQHHSCAAHHAIGQDTSRQVDVEILLRAGQIRRLYMGL